MRGTRSRSCSSWLHHPQTPVFKRGIHRAQRWFNLSWLLPDEQGYSRALPLRWVPAFPHKAVRHAHPACKEWEAALDGLRWLRVGLDERGRDQQVALLVADGSFDTLPLWAGLRYRVAGPFVRYGLPAVPLFLIVVGGQTYPTRSGRRKYREPVYYLVNARWQDGQWVLPLPLDSLLFWAWQRWKVEGAHREMKTSFGLGDKQCWNPQAAVRSVQWSAWVYALLLLAGYRTWGLCHGPPVPTRWWRGAGRWSLATLWRAYRAALWGDYQFRLLDFPTPGNWPAKETRLMGLTNAIYAAARP